MTILLTGSTGFVGRHLLARLQRDGHHILLPYRRSWSFDDWAEENDTDEVDAVINCAGEINDKGEMFESNVVFAHKLLSFVEDRNIPKFIQIGSSSEYGDMNEPRREDALCVPVDLYSATKLAATALCQGFASQYDMDVVVARPFSLYGPGDTPRKLIPRLIKSVFDGSIVDLNPWGRHDWIYIDDFIDGLCVLLRTSRALTKGEIVNFGTGISTTNSEVARSFRWDTAPRPPSFRRVEGPVGPDWVADITKARALGWAPKYDLRSGLSELIRREHETG